MADIAGADLNHPILNLSNQEKQYFGTLFNQADADKLGVVTGEVAVQFFEKTRVPANVLGEIWQLADTENRGLLTKPGFCVALRLIGHYQAGRDLSPELAFKSGPLPKFEGVPIPPAQPASPGLAVQPAPLQQQGTGVRIPPLNPDKCQQYARVFEQTGAQNGLLGGDAAKSIFERAGLPNDVLGRIWTLADREGKGSLDVTEFIIAMHLVTSFKSRSMTALPSVLPPGLYEAAARRGAPAPPSSRGGSVSTPVGPAPHAVPRQFTGGQAARAQSPLARQAFPTPGPITAQTTGGHWLITPQEKAKYDQFFATIDTTGTGVISGEQAVKFFSDSGLPEDTLASIWDLADINSEGRLNRDEFAVAMYLIRQQRSSPSGAAPLPAFLPPMLVPPSMRNQPRAEPQPTAPAFDNVANSQLPKSAADDLFGLDEPEQKATQPQAPTLTQQATGGSAAAFGAGAFGQPTSPASPPRQTFTPQQTGSMFKPFMPTSAFGATLAAQNTGGSNASSQPQQQQRAMPAAPNPMDDLLGDSNEEETKNITSDTTELANMSNQIGNLRTQMQDTQTKKTTHERDLAATNNTKRDLETRLAQFRAQYEQEVRTVKTLEEQLAKSRAETKDLQAQYAMIEGSYQDLQTQHQHVSAQLQADQQENASLKERMKQMNAEIAQLKPQIEKMRSEARQQKGMVAINKKQLATGEGERDKLTGDMATLKQEAADREMEAERARSVATPEPVIASPASASTNPFFRTTSNPKPAGEGRAMSPAGFAPPPPSQSAFDALFGPSFASQQQQSRTNTPPAVSFHAASGPSLSSDGRSTPSATPPNDIPPPPPGSRQFTPGVLPFRQPLSREDSIASSTRVLPPGSRMEEADNRSVATEPIANAFDDGDDVNTPPEQTSGPAVQSLQPSGQQAKSLAEAEHMPGAFPEESATPLSTAGGASPFPNGPSSLAKASHEDFDSAFAGFGETARDKGKAKEEDPFSPSASAAPAAGKGFGSEFPPIQDLAADDDDSDSDDEADKGFEDSFAPPPQHAANGHTAEAATAGVAAAGVAGVAALAGEHAIHDAPSTEHVEIAAPSVDAPQTAERATRPSFTEQDRAGTDLPEITAQTSPPSYEDTTADDRRGSNTLPPEFGGLLPSREDPTLVPHSVPHPQTPTPEASSTAVPAPAQAEPTHSAPAVTTNNAFDDGFDEFDDLAEAKEVEGEADAYGEASEARGDEWNPTFDSPTTSTVHTITTPAANGFSDFDAQFAGAGTSREPASASAFPEPKAPQPQNSNDWDAIFSSLDAPAPSTSLDTGAFPAPASTGAATASEPAAKSGANNLAMPTLGRALSTSSEHDDPILKRLTGMGYSRQVALDALEKYDYDISRAIDHLTGS